jgi:excisionase family DNA binding protein
MSGAARLAAVPSIRPVVAQAAPLPELESIRETARILRGSQTFVRLLLQRGELRAVKIGRRVLIERASILELIERGRNGGTP